MLPCVPFLHPLQAYFIVLAKLHKHMFGRNEFDGNFFVEERGGGILPNDGRDISCSF